jgi:chromosome partitioning protein
MASLANNNAKQIAISIARIGAELRFRVADGFHDRVIFRELFPIGLTALDAIEHGAQKGALTSSQLSARQEIEDLVDSLQLPIRTPGLEHMECRRLWHARVSDFYREQGAPAPDFS